MEAMMLARKSGDQKVMTKNDRDGMIVEIESWLARKVHTGSFTDGQRLKILDVINDHVGKSEKHLDVGPVKLVYNLTKKT